MSEEQGGSKLDKKSLGIGGASVFAVLTLLQGQGITLMNAGQERKNAEVLEKVIKTELRNNAQDERIKQIEGHLNAIEGHIKDGFKESRVDLRREVEKLSDIIRLAANDRYTKSENMAFTREINARFQRNEENIKQLQQAVQKGD